MSDPETPKKRRGCFFYGCITSLVVALVLLLVVVFITVKAVGYINAKIVEYTDTAPAPLPKVDMSSNELAALENRVSAFSAALDARSNTLPLTLNTAEVNALLQDSAQIKVMRLNDRFYVTLQGDQIKAQISLPLGEYYKMPFVKTAGRYLNGDALLAGVVTNSQVSFTIKSVDVKGSPLPPDYLARLQLMQDAAFTNVNNNPTNRAFFDHIESAVVQDGVLTVKPKQ